MPGKRSKSEERERKRRYRENRKPEKIHLDQEEERNRMKQRKLKQTDGERQLEKDVAKTAMKKNIAKFSLGGFEMENKKTEYNERKENQKIIKSLRDNQTREQHEGENIKAKERMTALRARRNEEEKN